MGYWLVYEVEEKEIAVYVICMGLQEFTMHASAKDLRFYSKNILDAVSRGEEVIISSRGKPSAKLTSFEEDDKKQVQFDPLFGTWKDHADIINSSKYVRKLSRETK